MMFSLQTWVESKDYHFIRRTPALVGSLLRAGYTNVTLNSIMAHRSNYRGCSQRVRSKIIMILRNMGFHDVEHCMNICDYTLEKYDQNPLLVENYNTGINL
ncbi:hypothetical protein SAMN05443529_14110 [Desulfosporosinus hippei DSM 8344]|uniref:Uncharacterized protein n=1 Tax=Desulfosporosinus hippei DSM 8344 TaxID=1121419 RepID=A0A1G8KU42_9FIRM|nr:hypothetical protein SAMN05443529_14110 [Desulfosporosinus hippei DSM 8344]